MTAALSLAPLSAKALPIADTIPSPMHPAIARVLGMLPVHGHDFAECYRLECVCPTCEMDGESCVDCDGGVYERDLSLEEIHDLTDDEAALVKRAVFTAAEKAAHAAHEEVTLCQSAVWAKRQQLNERGDEGSASQLANAVVELVMAEQAARRMR